MPKYNSINNIPAKLFFDVLETKDFNLLEPIEGEDAEEVFVAIYDDYFVKSNNYRSNEFLRLRQEIAFLTYKIESIVQLLDFLLFNTTTKEMRVTLLEALVEIGVNINIEANFYEETQNILQVELGILNNDLNFLKIDLENLSKENKETVFNFYETLVGLESIHERNLDDLMVLARYIEYEKLAVKKTEMQKKSQAKFNT